jgi:hypothetical protein
MKFPLIILLLFCLSQAVYAFQTVSLGLTVTDQSSAIIPNATARLKKDGNIVKEIIISEPQKLIFLNIKPARYILEVEAPGFTTFTEEIEVNSGNIQKTVKLEIDQIVENVTVERSERDKNLDPREGAFTNFLTKAEIDALPDDPELLKKALEQKFGEDAEFLVDGFSSKGLPRKSEIASIKVSQSSFDAEYHKIGIAIIEITTKPTSKFFGILIFDFNDAVLNAREPFSPIRYPEQNKFFGILLSGPIKKDKASFSLATGNTNSYNTANVIAQLPNGNFNNSQRSSSNHLNFNGKFTYNPSQFQTINLAYAYNKNDSRNLGVGGFDLPERAFNLNSQQNQIRYSQVGNVGQRFYNEFRFQYEKEISEIASASKAAAIIVLDAFNKGGAGNNVETRQQSFSVADNFLWGMKNHALKIGGILDYRRRTTISAENQSGTFTFSSLADFLANQPATFTQKSGNRNVKVSQFQLAAFIQDDIRLHKSLMLSLGLRYEWQNNLKDYNNFSPRLGFVWSPKEDGKTTFRGGVGVFYNWLESNTLATILSQNENQPSQTIIINPGFPNPYSSGTNQILQKSYWQKASDLKNPYIFLAQIGVQRQLSEKSSLRVQYSYQKGVHQFRSRDINAPIDYIRPDASLGQILQFESSAFFVRNSLRLDFNITPTKTTFFSVNYRLAKSISDTNGYFSLPSDNYDLRVDRSVSNDDQRHNIHTTLNWSLPKGLRFSTVFHANSPLPYNITTGRDNNGDTIFNDRPIGVLRNSERGTWQKQFDASLGWQFNLEKNKEDSPRLPDPNAQMIKGKTLMLDITSTNVFNQTNFQTFVGVQTSPFFHQPISSSNPRKVKISLKFSF